MKNKSCILMVLTVFLMGSVVFAKKSGLRWGPDEGATFRYRDAVKRCKSKGMRLPTVRELKAASKIASMHWLGACNDPSDCRDMAYFWTSNKAPRGSLLGDRSVVWLIGQINGSLKIEVRDFSSTGSDARVRCVKR